MAKLPLSYNTEDNKTGMDDFSAIPAATYIAQITSSQYKENNAKTGHYLQIIVKIISGKYTGRTLFENLNLDNPSAIAVEIANKTLNSICQSCDKVAVDDSEELHGIPMQIKVKVNPATTKYPESNSVSMFAKLDPGAVIEDTPESTPVTGAVSGAATGPSDGKKLPWEPK